MGRKGEGSRKLTYAASGVDIDAAGNAAERIKAKARATHGPEVLLGIGAFAGLYWLSGYRDPVLVSSADGVGTKLKIAIALDRHDTVGIDLVNHCVNDIFTCGASPLFFLDYIALGRLALGQVESIVGGLAGACREVGCALIGGETAEMPGLYAPGDYDLAGFIVGVVERDALLDTGSIRVGDALVGLPSSGLHTNGYSLVRKVFDLDGRGSSPLERFYSELGRTLGEELLEPHRCYYRALAPLLRSGEGGELGGRRAGVLKGMAHITGGGLIDNVARILPAGVAAVFRSEAWLVPPIFSLVQERGGVERNEMYRVFNMGIGMVVVCAPGDVGRITDAVPEARHIGEVVAWRGGKSVRIV